MTDCVKKKKRRVPFSPFHDRKRLYLRDVAALLARADFVHTESKSSFIFLFSRIFLRSTGVHLSEKCSNREKIR